MTDNMTREQRSATMARIRSKNTRVELEVRRLLRGHGYRYRLHADWLPGKPDIAFTSRRVAVFVDGDFWHGWKFSKWASKLAPYWREKISRNRNRDRRRRAQLRAMGWSVIRIWEHEVEKAGPACLRRIENVLRTKTVPRIVRWRKGRRKNAN
jgi:DNA mismatch endonuclease (patch repair protein)